MISLRSETGAQMGWLVDGLERRVLGRLRRICGRCCMYVCCID